MKKLLLITFLFIFPSLVFIGCGGEQEKISSYDINIVYNNELHTLTATQEVCYVNNSENAFKNLYFHLYPNAFREESKTRVVSIANFSEAYPNGESFGDINVINVMVEEKEVDFFIEGEDENILCVPLLNELYPNEFVDIRMSYEVIIPNVEHRFGYSSDTVNLANFYPIACVYNEGKGFAKDLYTSNGDPFYSEVANYNVTISYDSNLSLACSGEVISEDITDDKIKTKIKGEKIRDFVIVLSDKFSILPKEVDGVEIKYYYYNDQSPQDTVNLSMKALVFYIEKFGRYPYKQLSVVQNDFVYGGMEYPNLVMISDDLSKENMYYVIVHEIAHQWWYGLVGNDEYSEAWVDESLTEYSTALFFENHLEYGIEYETLITNANTTFKFYYDIYKKVCNEVDTSMARKLSEFETEPEYIHSIYTQGMLMYDSLRELIGEKKFYKCCQNYLNKYLYKNTTGSELIASFSRTSGRNLESFFNSYLKGDVLID